MSILYDLIFLILSVFYLPVYFFKRKFHSGFATRLSLGIPEASFFKKPVWVHAVSVGEAMSIRNLVGSLRSCFYGKQFVISTVTATGNKIVRNFAEPEDFVTYLPLDFSVTVRACIDRIKPAMFIIAETEIWPNLISYLYKKKIPVIIVNGRISDKSFFGYSCVKVLLKPVLEKISFFCVQSERDSARLISLGVNKDKIQVTGNMKFDFKGYGSVQSESSSLKEKMKLPKEAKLFVAASTHAGEEETVIDAYRGLLRIFPSLLLLLAPRHPERSRDIAKTLSKYGMRAIFISNLEDDCRNCLTRPVFILDSVGKLMDFYAIADIVFVGGSLVKKGGHNILEPAFLGKPVIFGPYMFNFRDIADSFLQDKACIQINGKEELQEAVAGLIRDPAKSEALCSNAKGVISRNQGATQRNFDLIKSYIKENCCRG